MDLPFYELYKDKREYLARIQALYYATRHTTTPAQNEKFEAIRRGLFNDLRTVFPKAPDKEAEATPIYLLDAIEAVLWNKAREDKAANDAARANAAMARTHLKAWDWPGLK